MKLTVEQEEKISQYVFDQGLKIPSLSDDVIDHLCCVIESELGKEKSFDELLSNAITDIAPNGLADLENKTIFLLNSKRILLMKKFMYLIGFIGSVTLTAGITFKLLSYPGANVLFIIGFLTFLLVFMPLYAIDRYKVAISKTISERLKVILGLTAAIITGLSGLFKLMHLQGTQILLLAGAFIFAVGYLPFFFFTMYKKSIA
ncbi:hypothetical protein D1816_13460 [Aquimarina sp. AD10]|uniref:hypothetical protein n=1 Tax=Aquimarina sp. AD10 TaxID=1714849 RepID=UPI000E49F488|nr:hypothetical protein [Aquimarina sp. AD10]AXT61310.1 hypothetical protein D1816_13460 [Aquimarina sp. AD10]RKN01495.1 hypothetical protein D7033_04515 [Aquimarina sp. AD10]